jgi:RNA binding exosome subunit
MAPVPLHYVDLRAFCFVTEDEKRVKGALRTFLPEEFPVKRAESEGYHGDRILVLSARTENADEVRTVLDRVGDLPADELNRVRGELGERVDENCSLFLTFDKQAAYSGEVRLGDGITFRAKVEAYPAKRKAALGNARDLFEGL